MDAQARGVAVRILYNVDHANPIPVPPPPEPDVELIASLGVPARAVAGVPDLMHHKYVVRDGDAVWTGSMNWTRRLVVAAGERDRDRRHPELAAAFTLDFEELWARATSSTAALSSRDRSTVGGVRCGPGSRPVTPTR